MITVIHNNLCPQSRAILEFLDENDIKFKIFDIAKEKFSITDLKALFRKLNKNPKKLILQSSDFYSKHFSGKEEVNEETILEIIIKEPTILQCPILINNKIAMHGNSLENLRYFLEK